MSQAVGGRLRDACLHPLSLCEGQYPQGWGQLLAVSSENNRLQGKGLGLGHFILPKEHFRQDVGFSEMCFHGERWNLSL